MLPILIIFAVLAANTSLLAVTPSLLIHIWKISRPLSTSTLPQRPLNKASSFHITSPSWQTLPSPLAGQHSFAGYTSLSIRPTDSLLLTTQHDVASSFVSTLATPVLPEESLTNDAVTGLLLAFFCILLGILSLSKKRNLPLLKTPDSPLSLSSNTLFCVSELAAADLKSGQSPTVSVARLSAETFNLASASSENAEGIPLAFVDDLQCRMDVIEASFRRIGIPLPLNTHDPSMPSGPVGSPVQTPGEYPLLAAQTSQVANTTPLSTLRKPNDDIPFHINVSGNLTLKENCPAPGGSPAPTPQTRTIPCSSSGRIKLGISGLTPDGYDRLRMRDRRMSGLGPRPLAARRSSMDEFDARSLALRARTTPSRTTTVPFLPITPRTTASLTSLHTTTPRSTTPTSLAPRGRQSTYTLTSDRTTYYSAATSQRQGSDFNGSLVTRRTLSDAGNPVASSHTPSRPSLVHSRSFNTAHSTREPGTGSGRSLSLSEYRPRQHKDEDFGSYSLLERSHKVTEEKRKRHFQFSEQSFNDIPLFEKRNQSQESLGREHYSRSSIGARTLSRASTSTSSSRSTDRCSSIEWFESPDRFPGRSNPASSVSHYPSTRTTTRTPRYPKPEPQFMEPFTHVSTQPVPKPSDPGNWRALLHSHIANDARSDAARRAGSSGLSFEPPSPTLAEVGSPRPDLYAEANVFNMAPHQHEVFNMSNVDRSIPTPISKDHHSLDCSKYPDSSILLEEDLTTAYRAPM